MTNTALATPLAPPSTGRPLGRGRMLGAVAIFACLAVLPFLFEALGEPFLVVLATRVLIFAIAALSLDLILGYGALVSFGHAAFVGIGAYSVAILSSHGVDEILLHFAAALGVAGLFALVTGAISLRTRGVYFIMITLAFAQMLYFLFLSLPTYNGQDGIALWNRSHAAGLVDPEGHRTFYALCLGLLLLYLALAARLLRSPFGRVLRGAKDNERRMEALGFDTFRYRLLAYILSGAVTGAAGALLANVGYFVGPSFLSWQHSGDLIVMVVLGGMGTVIGPVLGAAALVLLEELLPALLGLWDAEWSHSWRLVLGPLLVLLALGPRRGIAGLLLRKAPASRRAAPLSAALHG